jgi:hypothetical protein
MGMPTKNNITGDTIQSRLNTPEYESNYDRIFKKPKPKEKINDIPTKSQSTARNKKNI